MTNAVLLTVIILGVVLQGRAPNPLDIKTHGPDRRYTGAFPHNGLVIVQTRLTYYGSNGLPSEAQANSNGHSRAHLLRSMMWIRCSVPSPARR